MEIYYLYMLRCSDGSIYTGIAKDYEKRYKEHIELKGAKYTKSHKVTKIERVFICNSRSEASILENVFKKFTKKQKESYILAPSDFIKYIENIKKIKIIKKI